MQMAGREPNLRVTIGPYLSKRLCIIGSSWKIDLPSHLKLPMMGTVVGPGGSFLVFEFPRMDLMRAATQSMRMAINHVSIFGCYTAKLRFLGHRVSLCLTDSEIRLIFINFSLSYIIIY